jgi:hypothetical protein
MYNMTILQQYRNFAVTVPGFATGKIILVLLLKPTKFVGYLKNICSRLYIQVLLFPLTEPAVVCPEAS